jgi:hypothetical protein
MRYCVLAVDYDGTIASQGVVSEETTGLLKRVSDSGRKLVLVTGRQLPDVKKIFPALNIFHKVVAENGSLIYDPPTHTEKTLCEPPNQQLIDLLNQRKVKFDAGQCIIATWEPNHKPVLNAIKELGLDLQVIFHKGVVMVLPSSLNKASGLTRCSPRSASVTTQYSRDIGIPRIISSPPTLIDNSLANWTTNHNSNAVYGLSAVSKDFKGVAAIEMQRRALLVCERSSQWTLRTEAKGFL